MWCVGCSGSLSCGVLAAVGFFHVVCWLQWESFMWCVGCSGSLSCGVLAAVGVFHVVCWLQGV